MSAYLCISLSLLVYPIIGYFLVQFARIKPFLQRLMMGTLFLTSISVLSAVLTHTITISQNLNWFLITSGYLTVSVLLWLTKFSGSSMMFSLGKGLRILIFGFGFLAATAGIFFTVIVSLHFDTDQRKWLTNDLVYQERNIGQGPDPSIRLKEIEIFKRVNWLPFLATRIKAKTYDDWDGLLGSNLDVTYSQAKETIFLRSAEQEDGQVPWADTISLTNDRPR